MNIAVEHIAIPATNPAALRHWYDTRPRREARSSTTARIRRRCLIALPGGGWFEIYPPRRRRWRSAATTSWPVSGILPCACLRSTAAKTELEKRGVKFTEEIRPAAGGGQVLFFEDGEGNLLHFVERPAGFKL